MWIIVICLAYLFGISEFVLMMMKRSKKETVKRKGDKGSLISLYIVFTLSMTAGFFLADFRTQDLTYYISIFSGLAVYFLGLSLRWASIIQLKKAFTVDVAINQEHELKTDGLYRIVRHPSYLGLFLIFSGLAVSMNSILSFVVVSLPVFSVILYRIYIEEAVLNEEFGTEYAEYSRTTKRILPFIY